MGNRAVFYLPAVAVANEPRVQLTGGMWGNFCMKCTCRGCFVVSTVASGIVTGLPAVASA